MEQSRCRSGIWVACSLALFACGSPEHTGTNTGGSAGAPGDAATDAAAFGGSAEAEGNAGGASGSNAPFDAAADADGREDAGSSGGATGAHLTDRKAAPSCLARQETPAPTPVKVDLLFMIDNSSSMADKEDVLAQVVPDLVDRLINPVCVDAVTRAQLGARNSDGTCPRGVVEFPPIDDIHIGIITSSLGGHGSSGVCDPEDSRKTNPHNDDHAHLVARDKTDGVIPTFQNKGFLSWSPASGGAMSIQDLTQPFASMIRGVGQHGCGYEAQLEAIYRFLIDPAPYDKLTVDKTQAPTLGLAVATGVDTVLVQQRADFLRPDSLVAVIAVSDENDCSIIDEGQNFYVLVPPSGSPARSILTHGTSACLANPNDPCCYSCLLVNPPAGCPAPASDPECMKGNWLKTEDPENLRCFHQKQRYGMSFLYPVQRYIDGFTSTVVTDRNGTAVPNPLYSDLQCKNGVGCAPTRPKDLVFFAGIVGVPWQDVAVDANDLTLGYKTGTQLAGENVWAKILGDPDNPAGPVLPTDPHMVESIVPRAGLPGPNSLPNADPIHGHEWDPSKDSPPNADLQYACVFDIPPRTCASTDPDCDCYDSTVDKKSPVCQSPAGSYSTTQVRAKAYPGLRELQVVKGIGSQGVVASICPANPTNTLRSDYGFRPAISTLLRGVGISIKTCF